MADNGRGGNLLMGDKGKFIDLADIVRFWGSDWGLKVITLRVLGEAYQLNFIARCAKVMSCR